jgi:hypothetical protein
MTVRNSEVLEDRATHDGVRKRCSRCKQHKPTTEFGKNRGRKDGLHDRCRDCSTQWAREYYHSKEKFKPNYKPRHAKHQRVYAQKHKEVIKAHGAIAGLRRRRSKVACESCGTSEKALHLHHPDYNRPLDVITLCVSCHEAEHHRRDQ